MAVGLISVPISCQRPATMTQLKCQKLCFIYTFRRLQQRETVIPLCTSGGLQIGVFNFVPTPLICQNSHTRSNLEINKLKFHICLFRLVFQTIYFWKKCKYNEIKWLISNALALRGSEAETEYSSHPLLHKHWDICIF